MLGRAAVAVSEHPDVLAASAHFLRSPGTGEVEVRAEVLRQGRTATRGGRPCVEALLTMGHQAHESLAPTWQAPEPAAGVVGFDESIRLVPDPGVFRVPLMDRVDLRLDPATMGWTRGAPTGRGELRGWLALPDAEPFDPVSLLFALDAFPPATFDIAMSGWVPTLQLSAYVRAVPVPGPVRVLHRAQLIAGDRVDEVCVIWDRSGRLVAQSTQLAGIRLA